MAPIIILASLLNLYLPFSEEFGWQAYLLPKLMPLSVRKATLIVSAIWAICHWLYVFIGYEYGFDYWGAPIVGPLLWLVIVFFF